MKECDILRRSKHTLTHPTYFHGVKTPNPQELRLYRRALNTVQLRQGFVFHFSSAIYHTGKNIIPRIINILINHSQHSQYVQQWTLNCIHVVLPISRYL